MNVTRRRCLVWSQLVALLLGIVGTTSVSSSAEDQNDERLPCLEPSAIVGTYNASDLLSAVVTCREEKNYERAWEIYVISMVYYCYDVVRVYGTEEREDWPLGLLASVIFSDLSEEDYTQLREAVDKLSSPKERRRLCNWLTRIGPPEYDPMYVVPPEERHLRHRLDVRNDSATEGGASEEFDRDAQWERTVRQLLKCPE